MPFVAVAYFEKIRRMILLIKLVNFNVSMLVLRDRGHGDVVIMCVFCGRAG